MQVLKRIVDEYGGDLVVATLCLVETSRFGLLETELLDLLAIQPIIPGAKTIENLSVEGKLLMAKVRFVFSSLLVSYQLLEETLCLPSVYTWPCELDISVDSSMVI